MRTKVVNSVLMDVEERSFNQLKSELSEYIRRQAASFQVKIEKWWRICC
jgi:hypothetical protein